jgi:hypothetical protein
MNWNVWDITKSLAIGAVVVFIWVHGNALISSFNQPAPQPPQIIRIDENAVKLAAITASKQTADELRAQFKEEKSQILAEFERQRKETQERLDELGRVNLKLTQQVDLLNRSSDHTYTNVEKPKTTHDFKKIYRKDPEGLRYPVAWSMYYPFQDEDKRWKTGLYPLEYTINVIETENKDGTFNRYAEAYVENNQMKETRGQRFKLPITDIQWAKYPQKEKHWFWWNPRLALGGAFTNEDISAQLNLSISSYGKTTGDMDWRFFTFGVGGTKDGDDWKGVFSVEPFSWNMGKPIPLIDNLFVGPIFTLDTESEQGYGLQISVPF